MTVKELITVLSKIQDQNASVLTPDLFHIVRADEAVIKDKIVVVLSDLEDDCWGWGSPDSMESI